MSVSNYSVLNQILVTHKTLYYFNGFTPIAVVCFWHRSISHLFCSQVHGVCIVGMLHINVSQVPLYSPLSQSQVLIPGLLGQS